MSWRCVIYFLCSLCTLLTKWWQILQTVWRVTKNLSNLYWKAETKLCEIHINILLKYMILYVLMLPGLLSAPGHVFPGAWRQENMDGTALLLNLLECFSAGHLHNPHNQNDHYRRLSLPELWWNNNFFGGQTWQNVTVWHTTDSGFDLAPLYPVLLHISGEPGA